MMNVEFIARKATQLKKMKEEAWMLEKQLVEDLIQLDREAFDGLTWGEFMSSIKETVEINEDMTIKRESYRIDGTYRVDESVVLYVTGNIYFGDTRFGVSVHYEKSGRYLSSIPKKYQKEYDELVAEMKRYQFERPSDKFSKELGLTSF